RSAATVPNATGPGTDASAKTISPTKPSPYAMQHIGEHVAMTSPAAIDAATSEASPAPSATEISAPTWSTRAPAGGCQRNTRNDSVSATWTTVVAAGSSVTPRTAPTTSTVTNNPTRAAMTSLAPPVRAENVQKSLRRSRAGR